MKRLFFVKIIFMLFVGATICYAQDSKQYYVGIDGKYDVEYTVESLKRMAENGRFTKDTLVYNGAEWVAASTIPELAKLLATKNTPPPAPKQAGNSQAAQTKPRTGKPLLAVLPFTGVSQNEGESLATIFGNQKELDREYLVIPRQQIDSIMDEQDFAGLSGLTNQDTMIEMGKMSHADYVASGQIQNIGDKKLIIISIIDIGTLEQIAGDYIVFDAIDEAYDLIPEMVKKITLSKSKSKNKNSLAIRRFTIKGTNANQQDADVLAQILAIEIARTNTYRVLARTSALQTVLDEQDVQENSNLVDRSNAKAIGMGDNAQLVLSGSVDRIGNTNSFNAAILYIKGGARFATSDSRKYNNISEGIKLMPDISSELTGVKSQSSIKRKKAGKKQMAQQNASAFFNAITPAFVEFGPRASFDVRFYQKSVDMEYDFLVCPSFETGLQVSAMFGSGNFYFGLQTEANFTMDWAEQKIEYNYYTEFDSKSLTIPLLAKIYFAPWGIKKTSFTFLAGVYFTLPLGDMDYGYSIKENGSKVNIASYKYSVPLGILLGLGFDFEGFIVDFRYNTEFGNTSIMDSNDGILAIYKRSGIAFSLAYNWKIKIK